MIEKRIIRAALFDLDGVVFDTESQYTVFWGEQFRLYHPDKPGLEHKIKGQTLVQIFDAWFSDMKDEQPKIVARIDEFERNMKFEYVRGFMEFVSDLRRNGVKTAVVTSSNLAKMQLVYASHPEFKAMFDAVLTSEDFERSKPGSVRGQFQRAEGGACGRYGRCRAVNNQPARCHPSVLRPRNPRLCRS